MWCTKNALSTALFEEDEPFRNAVELVVTLVNAVVDVEGTPRATFEEIGHAIGQLEYLVQQRLDDLFIPPSQLFVHRRGICLNGLLVDLIDTRHTLRGALMQRDIDFDFDARAPSPDVTVHHVLDQLEAIRVASAAEIANGNGNAAAARALLPGSDQDAGAIEATAPTSAPTGTTTGNGYTNRQLQSALDEAAAVVDGIRVYGVTATAPNAVTVDENHRVPRVDAPAPTGTTPTAPTGTTPTAPTSAPTSAPTGTTPTAPTLALTSAPTGTTPTAPTSAPTGTTPTAPTSAPTGTTIGTDVEGLTAPDTLVPAPAPATDRLQLALAQDDEEDDVDAELQRLLEDAEESARELAGRALLRANGAAAATAELDEQVVVLTETVAQVVEREEQRDERVDRLEAQVNALSPPRRNPRRGKGKGGKKK